MLHIPTSPRVALLIDADNIQLTHAEQIVKLAHYFGQVAICRAYGDWTRCPLSTFHIHVTNLKINCVQVGRIAKDSTDKQLLIEAGELLGAADADIFIIASGDGDFRLLCERIRYKNRKVIGIGNKRQTSSNLRESCDRFCYIEQLGQILTKLEQTPIPEPTQLAEFAPFLFRAFDSMPSGKEGWIDRGLLGNKLHELEPNFKQRFGNKKLSEWLLDMNDWVETKGQMVRIIDPEMFEAVALMRVV